MNPPLTSRSPKGGAVPRPLPAPRGAARAFTHARHAFVSLPGLFRAGFVTLAAGAAADIVYHLSDRPQAPHGHGHSFDAATVIHLLVAAGMLVTLAGLVHAAMRSFRTSITTRRPSR